MARNKDFGDDPFGDDPFAGQPDASVSFGKTSTTPLDTRRISASQPTQPKKMGMFEQFGRGLKSGFEGINLGLAQGANALTGGRLLNPEILNEMEAERRAKAQEIKAARGGEAGFGNLGSWGEAVAEIGTGAALPGGLTAKAVGKLPTIGRIGSNVLREGLKGMAGGTIGGAVGGFTTPTVEGESRGLNTAVGAGLGATLGTVGGGVVGGVKRATTAPEQFIVEGLRKIAPEPPSRYKSRAALQKGQANRIEAVKDTVRLSDEIELPTKEGFSAKGKTPETQEQMYDAVNQSMGKVMGWTKKAESAGEAANLRIDPSNIVSELKAIASSDGFGPARRKQAAALAEDLQATVEKGGFSPSDALSRMRELNNDLKGYYLGQNTSGDSPEVLAIVANNLRQNINSAMENVTGEFGDLRRQWGRLSALNEDLLKNLEMRAGQQARGGMSVFDILSAQQALQATVGGRVDKLGQSLGSAAVGRLVNLWQSPDRTVKNIYKAAKRSVGDARQVEPEIKTFIGERMVKDPSTGRMIPATAGAPSPIMRPTPQAPVNNPLAGAVNTLRPTPQAQIKSQRIPIKSSDVLEPMFRTEGAKSVKLPKVSTAKLEEVATEFPEMTIQEFLALRGGK